MIDGICRDTARADAVGYSLFARARWMRTGKDRVRAAAMQVPVSLGGVLVSPGDLVVGDDDGIVVIAREHAEDVVGVAVEIERAEASIRTEAVDRGVRLDEARRLFGYHNLQTRAEST